MLLNHSSVIVRVTKYEVTILIIQSQFLHFEYLCNLQTAHHYCHKTRTITGEVMQANVRH